MQKNVKVIAHRSANNYKSALMAVKSGADILEGDVHMTKDGVLILHHTPYIQTNEKIYFSDNGLSCFKDIVTLEDMICLVKKEKKKLLLDVKVGKTFYSDISRKIISIINQMDAKEFVEIISFDHVCMEELILGDNEIKVGLMYVARLARLDLLLKELKPSFIEICADYLDDQAYEITKNNNVELYGWGTDDRDILLDYCNKGMSALTVNDVNAARRLLDGIIQV